VVLIQNCCCSVGVKSQESVILEKKKDGSDAAQEANFALMTWMNVVMDWNA
jgi:hypothetical protein